MKLRIKPILEHDPELTVDIWLEQMADSIILVGGACNKDGDYEEYNLLELTEKGVKFCDNIGLPFVTHEFGSLEIL